MPAMFPKLSTKKSYEDCSFEDLQLDFSKLREFVLANVHMAIKPEEAALFPGIVRAECFTYQHKILLATLTERLLADYLLQANNRHVGKLDPFLVKIIEVLACCDTSKMQLGEKHVEIGLRRFSQVSDKVCVESGKEISKIAAYAFELCRFRVYFSAALENALKSADNTEKEQKKHVTFKL